MPEHLTDPRAVAPLRCCERVADSIALACGARARWMRPDLTAEPLGYFCELHRRPKDVRIPESFTFRSVSVRLEVVLTGASFAPTLAHQEAYGRLLRAVEAAGGIVHLHEVSSRLCRYSPNLPAAGASSVPGRPRSH